MLNFSFYQSSFNTAVQRLFESVRKLLEPQTEGIPKHSCVFSCFSDSNLQSQRTQFCTFSLHDSVKRNLFELLRSLSSDWPSYRSLQRPRPSDWRPSVQSNLKFELLPLRMFTHYFYELDMFNMESELCFKLEKVWR